MAAYLIVDRNSEIPIITFAEAKNVQGAIESVKLKDGQSVEVYRIAQGPYIARLAGRVP
jgi:hypothetical protein